MSKKTKDSAAMSELDGITKEELAAFPKTEVALYKKVQDFVKENTDDLNTLDVTFVIAMGVNGARVEGKGRPVMHFNAVAGKGEQVAELLTEILAKCASRKLADALKKIS